MMKRIFLLIMTNILVMLTISILVQILGVGRYVTAYGLNYSALMVLCLIWGFAGSFISLFLSKFMAKMMMGVQVINPQTASGTEAELVQMVHTLARRAGITSMPEVGFYESDEVNAFATGPSKNNSLVAVSSGLMRRMNREQVEGVLGHEIAHVANGDMVTMTLIQGVVNAFVMFISRVLAFAISNNSRDENRSSAPNYFLVFLFEMIFGFLAMFVVAYFSRIREYRADFGGAQFAGRDKMISALQALQGTTELVSNENPSVATLKISGRGGLFALLSTHPSLEDRIERLQRGVNPN